MVLSSPPGISRRKSLAVCVGGEVGAEREPGVGGWGGMGQCGEDLCICDTLMQTKCKSTNRLGPNLWNKQLVGVTNSPSEGVAGRGCCLEVLHDFAFRALPVTCCVTLANLLNRSELQFP